jgi:glycosyltransferase involved in cell wall biosynthesis/CheY-like chemotaxis protein
MSYSLDLVASAENPALSFVIPVKDEQATLTALFRGIAAQAAKITNCWEVIFVDDGSADESWMVMEQLAAEHQERVKAIRFRHNAGKAAALAAGWNVSMGDIVFTMDADLQDDPEEIPRFLDKLREGFDVVTGWKRDRHDPWHKVLPSRIFNFILSRVNKVSLHDHNCGFKCYRREVTLSLPMYGEMHRMVPSLAAMQGFRTAEIPVKHHPRLHGQSKYGIKRFLRGFLDMWTVFFLQNFHQRPMHLMGAVSLLMVAGGACLALFLSRVPLPFSIFLLLSSALPALFIGAILNIMIGFLAEWNVHQSTAHSGHHPIAETIGVSIPSAEPFSEINRPAAASQAPMGATALLLDDKPAAREMNAKRLRDAGWKVLTASSCEEARTKLKSRIGIDVILFDLSIQDKPGLTVVEFVRSVRENSPSPEIVFLPSAKTSGSSVNQSMRNGSGDHHLVTPSTELLHIALRALCAGKKSINNFHFLRSL